MLKRAMHILQVCTIVWLGSLSATSVLAAAPDQASNAADTASAMRVLRIAAIQARNADGKPELVRDSGNREFRIAYNAAGRAESVKATLRPHVADIKQIAYLEDGRLAGVMYEAGYALFFQYLPDGRQVVRDGFGGLIARTGDARTGYVTTQSSDPAKRLSASLDSLDHLLDATKGARR